MFAGGSSFGDQVLGATVRQQKRSIGTIGFLIMIMTPYLHLIAHCRTLYC